MRGYTSSFSHSFRSQAARSQTVLRSLGMVAMVLILGSATTGFASEQGSEQGSKYIAEKYECSKVAVPLKKAKEAEKEAGFGEKFDAAFGEYLVGPLAAAMFYDLYFWDNGVDDGVKAAVDGKIFLGKRYGKWTSDPQLDDKGQPKTDEEGNPLEKGFEYHKQYRTWGSMVMPVTPLSPGRKAELKTTPKTELKLDYGVVKVEVVSDTDVKVTSAEIVLSGLALGDFDRWAGPAFRFADGQANAPAEGKVWSVVQGGSVPFATLVELGDDGKGTLLPIVLSKTKLSRIQPTGIQQAGIQPGNRGQKKPNGALSGKLEKGVQVWVGDAKCQRIDIATVESVNPDGSVLLTSTTTLYQTGNPIDTKVPIVVLWLVLGSLFFTLKMGFINVRAFTHALSVVKGDYDNPEDEGEITHFQALSSALSATVGLGNIAGVAIAVSLGGPGALFWMIMAGSLGMTSKFVECTLGQLYRRVNKDGVVLGGPMQYLKVGLAEFADEKLEGGSQAMLKTLGTGLAWLFAIMCIGGSFGGGNMFQGNQTFSLFKERIPSIAEYDWAFGLVLAVLVGLVIIGGIKRIGAAAAFLVPTMVGGYMLAGLYILVVNAGEIPWAIGVIVGEAFTPDAGFGGMVGVLILGFKRAAFSNEAGVGSAAIAHSAAATDEPVREGIVALLGPFIDTIVVCTMTGLVIVITRAYQVDGIGDGVLLTSLAFKSALPWFPWLLTVAVALFAFSTMISWSYYGERCATMLFGENASLPYRLVYCVFAFLGPVLTAHNVVGFSDLMILGMAFPNILGVALLSGKVKSRLDDYWGRYKSGSMQKTQ